MEFWNPRQIENEAIERETTKEVEEVVNSLLPSERSRLRRVALGKTVEEIASEDGVKLAPQKIVLKLVNGF